MSIHFTVNNKAMAFDGDVDMPLLWYLRDHAKLTGTKYGCGIAECGACTVHIDGRAARSCVIPLKDIEGKNIRTVEGLAQGKELHALQKAWIEVDVSQCGYCQSGQLMAAADLLSRNKDPDNKDIAGITNICRCGTYPRIRKAIKRAAQIIKEEKL